MDEIIQKTRKEALLKIAMNRQPSAGMQPGEEDQMSLAQTENQMIVFENKDMPVDPHDDHLVHLAIHQEAIGMGNDALLNKHMSIHEMYAGQGPQPPTQSAGSILPPTQGGQPGQPGQQPPGGQPQQGFPQKPPGGMGGGQPPPPGAGGTPPGGPTGGMPGM